MSERLDVHVHLHHHEPSDRVTERLDQILTRLGGIARQETHIMQELDDLTTQVKANTDAEQSAIVLINGIAARIAAAGTDPVVLQALTDSLKGSSDALAAAVIANTPPVV
jgi:cell division septum initiation protein DivIVA